MTPTSADIFHESRGQICFPGLGRGGEMLRLDAAEIRRGDGLYPWRHVPRARRVMVVAVLRFDGWAAYIDAVPGRCHDEEWRTIIGSGVKLLERVARGIFGDLHAIPDAK